MGGNSSHKGTKTRRHKGRKTKGQSSRASSLVLCVVVSCFSCPVFLPPKVSPGVEEERDAWPQFEPVSWVARGYQFIELPVSRLHLGLLGFRRNDQRLIRRSHALVVPDPAVIPEVPGQRPVIRTHDCDSGLISLTLLGQPVNLVD